MLGKFLGKVTETVVKETTEVVFVAPIKAVEGAVKGAEKGLDEFGKAIDGEE